MAEATISTDGRNPVATPHLTVTGGRSHKAAVDAGGIHVNDTSLSATQLQAANDTLNSALAATGVSVKLAGESVTKAGR